MIIVNAVNLSSGGGLTILLHFYKHAPVDSIFVVKNPDMVRRLSALRNFGPGLICPPPFLRWKGFALFVYFFWVHMVAKRNNASSVLSLGNIASRTSCRQVLYLHWAYYVYGLSSSSERKLSLKLKRKMKWHLINYFSRYVDLLVVQTKTMQNKAREAWRFARLDNVVYVYPGVTRTQGLKGEKLEEKGEVFRLIYPSLFYSHKNFEILLSAASIIDQRGCPVKIVLTLDEEIYCELGFNEFSCCENLGVLSANDMWESYSAHDAVLMPSKFETVGLPLIEGMCWGLPIVTSDLDFAREICGNHAFYFDPDDVESLMIALSDVVSQVRQGVRFDVSANQELAKFPSWKNSVQSIFLLLNNG